jgi:hypothetical protein
MSQKLRLICAGVVAAVCGALLAPGGAQAASYHFVGHHSVMGTSSIKNIFGYDSSNRQAAYGQLSNIGNGQTDVWICDNLADGQPVYIELLVKSGSVFSYKAPASNVVGNAGSGNPGCNDWIKGFEIVQFRVRIGGSLSGAIEAP